MVIIWLYKKYYAFEISRKSILELKYSYFCLCCAWEGVRKKALEGGTKCLAMDAMASPFVPWVPKHVLKPLEVLESHPGKCFSLDSSFFEIWETSASQWFHSATKPYWKMSENQQNASNFLKKLFLKVVCVSRWSLMYPRMILEQLS